MIELGQLGGNQSQKNKVLLKRKIDPLVGLLKTTNKNLNSCLNQLATDLAKISKKPNSVVSNSGKNFLSEKEDFLETETLLKNLSKFFQNSLTVLAFQCSVEGIFLGFFAGTFSILLYRLQ
jgi:TPP-dependent 2-oxoacid decarboxylase